MHNYTNHTIWYFVLLTLFSNIILHLISFFLSFYYLLNYLIFLLDLFYQYINYFLVFFYHFHQLLFLLLCLIQGIYFIFILLGFFIFFNQSIIFYIISYILICNIASTNFDALLLLMVIKELFIINIIVLFNWLWWLWNTFI